MPDSVDALSPEGLAKHLFDELCLERRRRFFVAFSGGRDSSVLLDIICRLCEAEQLELTALHFDHGLHPDSADWRRHCRQVCGRYGIALQAQAVQLEIDPGLGPEATARASRYRWFEQVMGDAPAYLLTAHHARDQAETVLLNLLRGAGVDGLAAMCPVVARGVHQVVRPLLATSSDDIGRYATRRGLSWVDDPSNLDTRVPRNAVRHRLMPQLEALKPDAVQRFMTVADNMSDARQILRDLADEDLAEVRTLERYPLDGSHGLFLADFQALSKPRAANLLRGWLRGLSYPAPGRDVMRQLIEWRGAGAAGSAILGAGEMQFRLYRDVLYVMPPLPDSVALESQEWLDPSRPLELLAAGIRPNCDARLAGAIAPANGEPLMVKPRAGGERVRLPGERMHRELKKIYQARNIPPWRRKLLPLVCRGDEIVAVPDVAQFGVLADRFSGPPLVAIESLNERAE